MKLIEGKVKAEGLKFAIVVSRFNSFITDRLLEGALDCLRRHGARDEDIEVVRTPGSFEIPAVAKKLVQRGRYDAVICLGAVIRGGTPHHQYISAEVTKGIAQLAMESPIPVSYGVITPDTLEQAIERAGTKMGNKGWDAALAAIEMANLYREISS
ncbi:MAG: 6,7-dimethyl-8-ribityllumazine synthase [Deltaproteobacteria bacterium]|nr:MAG: 6,7-dimethyl-8-ribityllumazine synthase [Deltaproteobacteria bacterium]HEX16342.1 6,7-dimethyl-8-ribityllumazine synthase [Deltaproteobacteria bacterium]